MLPNSLLTGPPQEPNRDAVRFKVVRSLWLAAPLVLVALTATADGAVQRPPPPPIAFPTNRVDHDLVVMRTTGRARRTLTFSGRDEGDPSWSPDGSRIAFDHYDGRRERVAVLDLRSGRATELGEGFNPDWSSHGRIVAVDAENFDDLVTMNADGSGRRKLGLTGAGIADETDPSWSPDGQRIAFVGDGLSVVNADGSGLRRIRQEGYGGAASWSPRGKRIAFDCVTRRFESCTVGSDGSRLRGLSRRGRHPNWSPRGDLVATTLEEPPGGIELVRPDGHLMRRVRGRLTSPDWSPNGKHLVAAHQGPTNVRLYAIDPAGTRNPEPHVATRRSRSGACLGSGRYETRLPPPPSQALLAGRARSSGPPHAHLGAAHTRQVLPRPARLVGARPGHPLRKRGRPLDRAAPRGPTAQADVDEDAGVESHAGRPTATRSGLKPEAESGSCVRAARRSLLVPGGGLFAWSRDGRSLAYAVWNGRTEQSDLYIKTEAAPARRLFEGIDGVPTWSPDGNRIAFSHTDPDPHSEAVLLVVDLAGNAVQIDDQPAGDPDWRPS